jgi:hypothetical protein
VKEGTCPMVRVRKNWRLRAVVAMREEAPLLSEPVELADGMAGVSVDGSRVIPSGTSRAVLRAGTGR